MSTVKPTTPEINVIIGPQHTSVDGKIFQPNNISVILENGHSYDIDEIIDMLEKIDKKKKKKKRIFRRIRHVGQALNTAMREAMDDDVHLSRK